MIQNFPITDTGVTNDHTMFGLNLSGTRGKTLRQNIYRVSMYYIAVSRGFLKLHNFVTFMGDLMFVNNIHFLIAIYFGIKFVTVEYVRNHTAKELSKYFKEVMIIYYGCSMIVHNFLMDM